MKKTIFNLCNVMGLWLLCQGVIAAEVNLSHEFSSGTPARASEVNANFNSVKSAVDDNHGRLSSIESDNTDQQTQIDGLDSRVTELENAVDTSPSFEVVGTLQSDVGTYNIMEMSFDVTPNGDLVRDSATVIPGVNNIYLALQVTDASLMNSLLRTLAISNTIPIMSIEFPAQNIQLALEEVYVTGVTYAPDDRQSASNFTIIGVNLSPESFMLTSSDSGFNSSWIDGMSRGRSSNCTTIPTLYRNTSSIPIVDPSETSFEWIRFSAASSSLPYIIGRPLYNPILLSNVQAAGNAPCYMAAAMELVSLGDVQVELYGTSATLFSTINLIGSVIEEYRFNISTKGLRQDIIIGYPEITFTP